jgi:hypothetical protein
MFSYGSISLSARLWFVIISECLYLAPLCFCCTTLRDVILAERCSASVMSTTCILQHEWYAGSPHVPHPMGPSPSASPLVACWSGATRAHNRSCLDKFGWGGCPPRQPGCGPSWCSWWVASIGCAPEDADGGWWQACLTSGGHRGHDGQPKSEPVRA